MTLMPVFVLLLVHAGGAKTIIIELSTVVYILGAEQLVPAIEILQKSPNQCTRVHRLWYHLCREVESNPASPAQ